MDDLVARLRAQLDGDERVALAATEAEAYITLTLKAAHLDGDEGARALVEHHHRHRPANTLRWVRAAREILDQGDRARVGVKEHPEDFALKGALVALYGAVRALASVYGDGDG